MDQASHIWKMLDDMAASDPEAYKKFVEQNIQTGMEEMKKERQEKVDSISINPNFAFSMKIWGNLQKQCINELEAKLTLKQNEYKQETYQLEKAEKRIKFYFNVLHHDRVLGAFDKNDKPTDDPKCYNLIPLSVQNVQIGKSTSFGTIVYFYDVVVNSTVLNKINKQLLQTIILDTLQKRIEIDRNPLQFTFYKAFYKLELPSLKVISKQYKYCGQKKQIKIVLEAQADKDGRNAPEIPTPQKQTESFTKQLDQIIMPTQITTQQNQQQIKKPLIEVIDDKPYNLIEDKEKITILINVDVDSFQDIDLSISEYRMKLETKNGQMIDIDFKCKVDDNHPQAKWDRKKKQLRIIVNKIL